MLKRITLAVLAMSLAVNAAEGQAKSDQANVDGIVKSYIAVQKLLADDKSDGIAAELHKIHESATALAEAGISDKLASEAKAVAKAAAIEPKDVKEARTSFKPLSTAVIALVKLAPPTTGVATALFEVSCPMAEANWLQTSKEITNPYMGKEMLSCGKVEREIKPVEGTKNQK